MFITRSSAVHSKDVIFLVVQRPTWPNVAFGKNVQSPILLLPLSRGCPIDNHIENMHIILCKITANIENTNFAGEVLSVTSASI